MLYLHGHIVDDLLNPFAESTLTQTPPGGSRWKLQSVYTPGKRKSPGRTMSVGGRQKSKKVRIHSRYALFFSSLTDF
jgi:hypothetical protein